MAYSVNSCFSLGTPQFTSELGYSNPEIGRVLTISMKARAIPKLLSGFVVDRSGGKNVIIGGLCKLLSTLDRHFPGDIGVFCAFF